MNFFIILISLCAFGAVTLLAIVVYRTKQLNAQSKELSKRLEFWLSERKIGGKYGTSELVEENPEETFTKRVLIPIGEQVGKWVSEKVPYHKQSGVRKLLIRAGYRDKKALIYFYSIKALVACALCAALLFLFSVLSPNFLEASLNIILIAGIAGVVGYRAPNIIIQRKAGERQQNIDRVLPDALDLLVICTEAGMGIDVSLLRVATNLGGKGKALSEEIIFTNREMNLGMERSSCWENMGERTNSEELKGLARVIAQSEKVGSSVSNVLRAQSDFLRVKRRQKAEETAAKMTIKMMIPMALFIFPCIMAVTLGPPMLKLIVSFKGLQ